MPAGLRRHEPFYFCQTINILIKSFAMRKIFTTALRKTSGLLALVAFAVFGTASAQADADGNLWLAFKVGSEPLVSVSQKVPSTFLSYYAPGDPEGIISLSFTNPLPDIENRIVLTEASRVVIGYGDL